MSVVLCGAFLHSCDEPAEPADGMTPTRVEVDWSGYGKDTPTGMTLLFHNIATGEKTQTAGNDISCAVHGLPPGRYSATVFNLTEEEFADIGFRGLHSAETAEAYAKQHTGSRWYDTPQPENSYVARQPEWLATDTIMITAVEPHSPGTQPAAKPAGTLHPENIIHTLHVAIHIDNIGNLSAARGAVSGLAAGRRLAASRPDDNALTATHLVESGDWTRTHTTSSGPASGLIKADIRCFGLPSGHTGTPAENTLELQVLLADGKTVKRYLLPVGHLIETAATPPPLRGDNLDLYLELRLDPALPPLSGGGTTGGIDVWFNDWDEYINFDMPI